MLYSQEDFTTLKIIFFAFELKAILFWKRKLILDTQ